jgi:hypothetical protein
MQHLSFVKLAFKFIATANSKLQRNSRFYVQMLPLMAVTVGSSGCFNPERQQQYDSHSYSAQITLGKVTI